MGILNDRVVIIISRQGRVRQALPAENQLKASLCQ